MSITGIILAAAIVGGTGLFIALFLGVAGEKFKVEIDEREEAVLEALPGNNCGGCGFAGCSGLAAAIVEGSAAVSACPVGGAPVAEKIASIMGQDPGDAVRQTAFVKCAGTCEKAKNDFEYYGVKACSMMAGVPSNGPKSCNFGCLGYGECVSACPFDAIHIQDGIAVVDKDACKACGKCIKACPRHLIELVPYEQLHMVQCSSHDKGKNVMSACSAGCIGCMMCQKVCQYDAITIEDNIAHIDYSKCTNCGACAEKCPKKIIL